MTELRPHAGLLAVLALLGACSAPQLSPGGFRNPAQPISSIAVLEVARLDGRWQEAGGYGPGCAPAPMLEISGGGTAISGSSCFLPVAGTLALQPSGPGRFRAGSAEFWLLWVDFDYRTILIGTPSGEFGALLNRGGPIPDDRLEAARRILAFNGYDPAALRILP